MRTLLLITLLGLVLTRFVMAGDVIDDEGIKTLLRTRVEASKGIEGMAVGILDDKGSRIIVCGRTEGRMGPMVDGDTVFEIGSVTKVFTSLILADMVERGEVKLEDPIAKYLPASVKVPSRKGQQIRLVDLATHTSGLPSLPDNLSPADPQNPYADYTVKDLYAFLGSYSLTKDIGAEYDYSNLGGGLLGHVLALRAGTNYEALVEQRICDPLGMTNTVIKLPPELKERLAQGHDESGEVVSNWDFPTLAGAGALRSTANDLLKFLAAAMGSVKTSLQPAFALSETPRHAAGGMQIGLGWHILNKYGEDLVWHNGGTGGYRSFIGFDQKRQRAVVVLVDSANSVDELGFRLLESGLEPAVKKGHVAAPFEAKIFDQYVGEYEFQPGATLTMKREGDRFYTKLTHQDFLEIFPESETEFFLKVVDAQLTFVKDEKGKVVAVVLHQGGMDQRAKRVR